MTIKCYFCKKEGLFNYNLMRVCQDHYDRMLLREQQLKEERNKLKEVQNG